MSLTFYPSNRAAYNLFALLTGAPRRIGHTYLHKNRSQLNWLKNDTLPEDPRAHCVEQNVRLLSRLGISPEPDDIPGMEIFLTPEERAKSATLHERIAASKIIGVHAGTSTFKNQNRRRWPKEKFIELVNRFPNCHFLLFGTKEEEDVNRIIHANATENSRVLIIGNRPLREVVALIGACDIFVSNDSGLMHIAAAMRVPTLALLGPTNPDFIHPWRTPHLLVRTGIECSPCYYYSPKPLTCIRKIDFKCMTDLSVDMAGDALTHLMAQCGGSREF